MSPLERLFHERLDRGPVEGLWTLEDDVADGLAAPLEDLLRILEFRTAEEEQADPARKDGDGENRVGSPLRGAEADSESVVVVVNQLDCSRKARAIFARTLRAREAMSGVYFERNPSSSCRGVFFFTVGLGSVAGLL